MTSAAEAKRAVRSKSKNGFVSFVEFIIALQFCADLVEEEKYFKILGFIFLWGGRGGSLSDERHTLYAGLIWQGHKQCLITQSV